jgi:hypothetical protein
VLTNAVRAALGLAGAGAARRRRRDACVRDRHVRVWALFGHGAMSVLCPLRAAKRTSRRPRRQHRNHCLTFPRYPGVVADLSRVPRQLVKAMQSIQTTDPKEARRARLAQFQGHKATLTLMGSTVTGLVQSVKEDATSTPRRWIVTVVGMQGRRGLIEFCVPRPVLRRMQN